MGWSGWVHEAWLFVLALAYSSLYREDLLTFACVVDLEAGLARCV